MSFFIRNLFNLCPSNSSLININLTRILLSKSILNNYCYKVNFVNFRKMSKTTTAAADDNTMSVETRNVLDRIRSIVPPLSNDWHKGQAGRIGVIGGSIEYTGAPYFAAISALKVGADLVHVFCQQQAASVIKSYSPELIVHPLLDSENAQDQIEPWLERLHVLIIGPGLGRERNIINTVIELIRFCRKCSKPMIIDADGLHIITQYPDLIKNYDKAILTPNAIEFSRLFGSERELIPGRIKILGNGVTVLEKGRNDRIHISRTTEKYECPPGGSGRRCGGQGDLLCGALATFYHWSLLSKRDPNPAFIASFAASFLTKQCNAKAFQKYGRSTTTTNLIEQIHDVFQEYFEIN